jgi:hypothetical protein
LEWFAFLFENILFPLGLYPSAHRPITPTLSLLSLQNNPVASSKFPWGCVAWLQPANLDSLPFKNNQINYPQSPVGSLWLKSSPQAERS